MKATYLHEVSSAFTGLTAYVFSFFLLFFGLLCGKYFSKLTKVSKPRFG